MLYTSAALIALRVKASVLPTGNSLVQSSFVMSDLVETTGIHFMEKSIEDPSAVFSFLAELMPGLEGRDTFKLSKVSGGITNALYLCECSKVQDPFLLRVFGEGTEFIDREEEAGLLQTLGSKGLGPKLLAKFSNGRIEQYLSDFSTSSPEQMSNEPCVAAIAARLSSLHSVETTWCGCSLWSQLDMLFDLASTRRLEFPEANIPDLDQYKKVLGVVKKGIETRKEGSNDRGRFAALPYETVLAHNDLLSGNIMLKVSAGVDAPPEVMLIDFEYAARSERAYDIANHFCEYSGFDFDLENLFPSAERRRIFLEPYIRSCYPTEDLNADSINEAVTEMERALPLFCLLSNLYWGIWSIVRHGQSDVDFDYLEYSELRLAHGLEFHSNLFEIDLNEQ